MQTPPAPSLFSAFYLIFFQVHARRSAVGVGPQDPAGCPGGTVVALVRVRVLDLVTHVSLLFSRRTLGR